jgi:hypothetical protein
VPAEPYLTLAARGLSAVETAQPLFAALGGGAALGSVLALALEVRKDVPRWDRAAAHGTVGGALFGAFLLVVDMSRVV